jgi:hypothetical protein
MITNKNHSTLLGGRMLFPIALLIGALLINACSPTSRVPVTGGSDSENNNSPTSSNTPVVAATTPLKGSSGDTTIPQQANVPNSNAKCDALFLANYNVGMALAMMVNLTADTNYSAYTSPDSPFYLDFKKLRSELDTLATLPDPSDADALIVGKPSEAIAYFHQLADLAETDIKNQGKPFVDTSPSGVKLIGIDTPWEQHAATFGVAMGNVCKNYTAPSDLFSGTLVATVDPQVGQANDSLMATAAAADASMIATLNVAETAFPEPTETPAP